ncbi:MAG: M14 family zinc carboxypeptidase [Oscillospiraceae bacterium]
MNFLYENAGCVGEPEIAKRLFELAKMSFTKLRVLGKSVCGRPIYALEIGNMNNPSMIVGGTHGMEWASVLTALRLCDTAVEAVHDGELLCGIDMRVALLRRGTVVIPLLNPDGFELRRRGRAAACKTHRLLSRFEDADFGYWQANARGVDINHNFPAGFYLAKRQVAKLGIISASPTRYGGSFPLSEPESRAVVHAVGLYRPRSLYALHSQGEEIYWKYGSVIPDGSEYIASVLTALSGYRLCEPAALASHAGLKDWFIKRHCRPGFTIELGAGKNPLPYSDFEAIWNRVEKALTVAAIV